jgi:hypothetical protein
VQVTPTLPSLSAIHEACAGQSGCSFPGTSAGARMTTAAGFPHPGISQTGIEGRALISMGPHRGLFRVAGERPYHRDAGKKAARSSRGSRGPTDAPVTRSGEFTSPFRSLYADRLSSQPTLLESGEFGVSSPASPVATSPG